GAGALLRRGLWAGAAVAARTRPEEPRTRPTVDALGPLEARPNGRGLEGSAVRRQPGAARLPVADAEPVRLGGADGRLLLQRRPQPANHQRPRRLSRHRPRLLLPLLFPGDGPRPRPAQAVLVSADLVRQH